MLSQYHLHTTKSAQPAENHKEMEQKVHGGESSENNELAGLRKLALNWVKIYKNMS